MARNDVVLLDSLIEKARSRLGTARKLSEIFELFSFEQILKEYDLSYEELETGWVDGGDDGGIDGFFFLVDGKLQMDTNIDRAAKRNPKLKLVIVTAKHGDSFRQVPVNNMISSLQELLDLRITEGLLKSAFNERILELRRVFRKTYVGLADRRPETRVTVYYCCRGETSKIANNVTKRGQLLQKILSELFGDESTKVEFLGAAELLGMARKQRSYALRLRFVENFISRERTNYVVLCPLLSYYGFITDEGGNLRRYLFESNVRDYLGEVRINRDIQDTLNVQTESNKEDFWWLNNGITLLATHATVAGKELSLENVQIVNGLQTTETIFKHFKTGGIRDDDRAVLVKIALTEDELIRDKIIKATNYQNMVDLGSLRGTDKIQRDIEHFLSDYGWFYDRRKNFYKNQGKPSDRIISIPYLASAVRALALRDPAGSRRQRSRSLREDSTYEAVFNNKWDLRVYLVCLEITRTVEVALSPKRTLMYTPPIALTHFIAYVYVCRLLGSHKYAPDDLITLVGKVPSRSEVEAIRNELMGSQHMTTRRKRRGIRWKKDSINKFVSKTTQLLEN